MPILASLLTTALLLVLLASLSTVFGGSVGTLALLVLSATVAVLYARLSALALVLRAARLHVVVGGTLGAAAAWQLRRTGFAPTESFIAAIAALAAAYGLPRPLAAALMAWPAALSLRDGVDYWVGREMPMRSVAPFPQLASVIDTRGFGWLLNVPAYIFVPVALGFASWLILWRSPLIRVTAGRAAAMSAAAFTTGVLLSGFALSLAAFVRGDREEFIVGDLVGSANQSAVRTTVLAHEVVLGMAQGPIGAGVRGVASGIALSTALAVLLPLLVLPLLPLAREPGLRRSQAVVGGISANVLVSLYLGWLASPDTTGPLITALSGLGVAVVGFAVYWWRPLLTYPLTSAWDLLLYGVDARASSNADRPRATSYSTDEDDGFAQAEAEELEPAERAIPLLHLRSAFWDECQRLIGARLSDHVVMVHTRSPQEAQAALSYLSRGRRQLAAHRARAELAARDLDARRDVTAISRVFRDWQSGSFDPLPSAILSQLLAIGRALDAALREPLVYYRLRQLADVDNRLAELERREQTAHDPYEMRFLIASRRWRAVISAHASQIDRRLSERGTLRNAHIWSVPLRGDEPVYVPRRSAGAALRQYLEEYRHPVLVRGPAGIGKTTLLNRFELESGGGVPLISLRAPESLAWSVGHVALVSWMVHEAGSVLARKGYRLVEPDRADIIGDALGALLGWLDAVSAAVGAPAVIGVGGFHHLLAAVGQQRMEPEFFARVLTHGGARLRWVLLTATGPTDVRRQLPYGRPHWSYLRLPPFDPDEFAGMLAASEVTSGCTYSPEARQLLLSLSGGHPQLLQLVCSTVIDTKNDQPVATRPFVEVGDVDQAVSNALDAGSDVFQRIERQIGPTATTLARRLAQAGVGATLPRTYFADAAAGARRRAAPTVLLQTGLLEARGAGYAFGAELTRRWFARSATDAHSNR